MSSISRIPHMRAHTLTLMATRSQDQQLVAEVASDLAVADRSALSDLSVRNGVVPAFGWHPWFSYQLFDDGAEEVTYKPRGESEEDVQEAKRKHYAAVLQPAPSPDFILDLPAPTPLSSFLTLTRTHLSTYPTALVGEIGLDKAFRLPQSWDSSTHAARDSSLTAGGREGRLLSPHRVRMPHQQAVLKAQLQLAGELGRAVSVHGVQAHGVLYDTLAGCWKGFEKEVVSRREQKRVAPGAEDFSSDEEDGEEEGGKPFPPRICLHSFSGAPEVLKQYLHPSIPAKIFVSFSECINMVSENGKSKIDEVLKMVPDDRVLVESDLHIAGEDMDNALEEMYRKVCEVKGWELEDGTRKIGRNYEEFIFG
ncbi:Fc.00g087100.m01.CDS01 [Cosmosporella sp. VM-42]